MSRKYKFVGVYKQMPD